MPMLTPGEGEAAAGPCALTLVPSPPSAHQRSGFSVLTPKTVPSGEAA
ncbi:hypothetical protein SAMN05216268_105440 [Streptomyces yunnanensis]|uniref:Uncharacterized protein n=1 Tax=Streptomyces yunnanensis TaxID=156453 RepID=A0A9X8MSV6_9ACTN|nr:hypothetical protein SAMN05216268_105440 [Streptomyces yunnanensis]